MVLDSIKYDWPKGFKWGKYSIKDLKGAKVEKVERIGKIVVIKLFRNSGSISRDAGPAARYPRPTSSPALDAFISEKSFSAFSREELIRENHAAGARRGSPTRVTRLSILIHLKLTGQLIYVEGKSRIAGGHPLPPLNKPVPNSTTRVTLTFNKGKLYFNDMRKFGWVKIIKDSELKEESYIKKLGPDPLVISYEQFRERLVKKKQGRIKKTLMDQSVISGIGNIYSDEGLWRAKVHPKRSVITLTDKEIKAIYDGVRASFKLSIEKGGSSANAYVDSGGEKGLYLSFGKAYHMTGKPCSRCKTPIERMKLDGRSAHFCPKCQKLN